MLCSKLIRVCFTAKAKNHKLLIALKVNEGLVAYQETNKTLQFLFQLETKFSVTYVPATCFFAL